MQHIHLPFRGALWELSSYPCCPVLRSRHSLSTLPFYSITLWIILGVLTFPCCVQCLIFKVGVLGPWNCDPYYSKSLPAIASRLAVGRINEDFSLDLGCTMDFVSPSRGLRDFQSLDLICAIWERGGCVCRPFKSRILQCCGAHGQELGQVYVFMGVH